MTRTDEDIARVVHAANLALQHADSDPAPAQPWESEDPAVKALLIANVRLARKGAEPAELHDAWVLGKVLRGWVHGELKDRQAKTHPCLVPWEELTSQQRDKDRLTVAITRALAGET